MIPKLLSQFVLAAACLYSFMIVTPDAAWAGWSDQSFDAVYRKGVFFVDDNTGWVVGANGAIHKTTDGGTNWNPQTSNTSEYLYDVQFLDANTGYVVGDNGTIIKTTDGGTNWAVKTTGVYNHLQGVHFPVNATTGYAVGYAGSIYKTVDGGNNWTPQSSNTTEILYDVAFPVDNNTGYAVGGGSGTGVIIKTTDGGATAWTVQASALVHGMLTVHFPVDASTGYVSGTTGDFRKTTDGGSNWIQNDPPVMVLYNSVYFLDNNTGYLAGNSGKILRTDNGGLSWVEQTSGTSEFLMDVHFPLNATTGWIVGDNGTILKTSDGGDLLDMAHHPTGIGATDQFTPTGAATNWDTVNDQSGNAGTGTPETNDSATYSLGTTGQRVMFSLDNSTVPANSIITALEIRAQTYRGNGSGANVSFSYQRRPGATTPDASPINDTGEDWTTTCCTVRSSSWTGLNWTTTDLDNLEIGLAHNSGGSDAYVTQLFAFITYSPTTCPGGIVTSTADSGASSLRECIEYANSNPGTTISFNIPTSDSGFQPDPGDGNRWWKISPGSPLPAITADNTIIDATTQTANQGNTNTAGPEIEIDGSGAGHTSPVR